MKRDVVYILLICLLLLKMSHEALKYRNMAPPPPIQHEDVERHHYDVMIVFPFKNRDHHKRRMVHYLGNYTNVRFPNTSFLFVVADQMDDELFSRSWVFNAGVLAAEKMGFTSTCVIIHDVDRFPHNNAPTVPYDTCEMPTQLCSENDEWPKKGVPYLEFAGGIVTMKREHWRKINGMSNKYRGWGGEDDDMFVRLKRNNLLDPKTRLITRPPKGHGRFGAFPVNHHHTRDENKLAYNHNVQLLKQLKGFPNAWKDDGFSDCKFRIGNVKHDRVTWDHVETIQISLTLN